MKFKRHLALLLWLPGAAFLSFAQERESLTNVWKFRLPDRGTESSPALAPDGTIYQGTFHGWLVAVSPEGKQIWRFKAGREIKSSPAIGEDGTIYFGCRDGKFYAVTPKGKLKWSFPTGGWVDSSPAIAADGTVCFGSWDKNFYALKPDGNLKWKFTAGDIISSSPAIGSDGTIYFGSHDKTFYALAPDGSLKWKFATGGQITASPAIGIAGSTYFGSTDGNLYALNADGTERWHLHTGGYSSSSPVIDADENVYLALAKDRIQISRDGQLRWKIYGNNLITSASLCLNNGYIFTSGPWSPSGLVNTKGEFLAIFSVGFGFYSSPTISSNGIVYLADEMYLYAVAASRTMAPPKNLAWPMWRANPQHTGRVGK